MAGSILVVCIGAGTALANPPSDHGIGLVAGNGIDFSKAGGVAFEVGVHFADEVALTGRLTNMGEWYHAALEARWFPTGGAWRPYVFAGVGQLNIEALFENFVELGIGGEFRFGRDHWAVFGEAAIDLPTSARADGQDVMVTRSPYAGVGLRFVL